MKASKVIAAASPLLLAGLLSWASGVVVAEQPRTGQPTNATQL